MNTPDYIARFISRKTLTTSSSGGNCVLIDSRVVRMIKSLASASGISISGFINNVLIDHFENYKPEIIEVVNLSVNLLDSELKDE